MSRTVALMKNSITALIMQVVTLISGFVLPSLILSYYGSEVNGLISSINQYLSYFSLVEAGLAGACTFALYKPLANKDTYEVAGIVSASRKMYLRIGYLFLSLVLALAFIYPVFIKTKLLANWEIFLLILILGANGLQNFFVGAKYAILLTADQRVYVKNILTTLTIIGNMLIAIICTKAGLSVVVYRALGLLSIGIQPISYYLYCKNRYKYLNKKVQPLNNRITKRKDALVLQLLGMTHTSVPIMIATFMLPLEQLSVYSIYNMVIMGITGLAGVFTNGLGSSFGEIIALGDKQLLRKVFNEYEEFYYILMAFIFSCTICLIHPFVRVYTQKLPDASIYNNTLFAILISISAIFYAIKHPQGTLIGSAGLYKETRTASLIQALLAIICCPIFMHFFGIIGIPAGLIVSDVYRDIELLIFMPKTLENCNSKKSFLRAFKMLAEITIIFLSVYFLDLSMVNSYGTWIIFAIIVALYSIAIIMIIELIFEHKTLKLLWGRVTNVLSRFFKRKEA